MTREQIDQLQPPPNFAKEADGNARWYREAIGSAQCWELDALDPQFMIDLIRREIDAMVDDRHGWQRSEAVEDGHRELLRQTSARWDEVADWLAA